MICYNVLLNNEHRCNGKTSCVHAMPKRKNRCFSLIVHVSEFRANVPSVDEAVWISIGQILPDLRVSVHMLNAHETFRKYARVLRPGMPLSHLR